MNVLFAQKIAGVSGSEYYLLKIMPALKKQGINVVFFGISTPSEDHLNDPIYHVCKENEIEYRKYLMKSSLDFRVISAIGKVVREFDIDILHSHLLHADFWLALCRALNGKVRLISTKHGYQESYLAEEGFKFQTIRRNAYWFAARIAELFTDKSFAISKGLYDLYIHLGICNKSKLSIIRYGYDFDIAPVADPALRVAKYQLIIVGRLVHFKGHQYAIEAMKFLREKYHDIKLIIVGQGILESSLKKMVSRMELDEHVRFVGHRDNVREYMSSSDVMLVPSIAEGFGIVILEGFSVKVPIVAFDVPSPSELIDSGKDGLLATPFSSESLSDKISELLSDEQKRQQLSENAFAKLIDHYTLKRMIDETISFYKNVLREGFHSRAI